MVAMETHFGPEFFVGNRQKLRTLFAGTAPIVITANGLLQRNSDVTYPFRQDSSFWYLTGLDEPDLILVMDKDKEYLVLPERDPVQNIFDGTIKAEVLSDKSGISAVMDYKDGLKQLNSRLKKVKHVATIGAPPAYISQQGFYTNPARAALIARIKDLAPDAHLLDLQPHLTRQRSIKQPDELAALQSAISNTTTALKAVSKKLSKYKNEREIEADITQKFRRRASYHGYDPIVAGGANACTLHYQGNDATLSVKELVLIDVGSEVNHYSADITRTYSLTRPTKRQRDIHSAVIEVQNFALEHLKPGISLHAYEEEVEQFMGEKLRELHLIKSISHENVRKYYPHGTSHFLGLDVHDVGDYKRPLEPNMVITVEPGIYVPEEGIGVRIEDDVLITSEGVKVLSSGLPRTLS
jgi:Xaa-Pro aminopeptidase